MFWQICSLPLSRRKNISFDKNYTAKVIGLVKERVNFVKEFWEQASFFFAAPVEYDEKTVKKRWKAETPKQMEELGEMLKSIPDFSPEAQEHAVKSWIEEKQYGSGAILNAFLLALVGEAKGPHLFDISAAIGKEETLKRLKNAINRIAL